MKKVFILALLAATMSACVDQSNFESATFVDTSPGVSSSIETVVSEYNEQRAAIGQESIVPGLQCTLYNVPNTTTAIIGATLTTVGSWGYHGTFNQPNGSSSPGLNVLPPLLQHIYTSYYIVKCTGLLIVTASGFYGFDLSSDDGANLYVSGLLINNDGTHGITTKSAAKYLARGVVSFEIDFLDIGGSHALMLMSGGLPLPSENFYH